MKSLNFSIVIIFLLSLTLSSCINKDSKSVESVPTESTEEEIITPIVYIGLNVHMEGRDTSTEQLHTQATNKFMEYAELFDSYNAIATWEAKEMILSSVKFEDDFYLKLYEMGQGVGVHADLPYNASSLNVLINALTIKKQMLENIGVPINNVSGACSQLYWPQAVVESGYQVVDGIVEYSAYCLGEDDWPEGLESDDKPSDAHALFPYEYDKRFHPWFCSDTNWLIEDPDGELLILPSVINTLNFLYEHENDIAYVVGGETLLTAEDIDIYFKELDYAIKIADPERINAFFCSISIGVFPDMLVMEDWLARIEVYVDEGTVVWAATGDMYEICDDMRRK